MNPHPVKLINAKKNFSFLSPPTVTKFLSCVCNLNLLKLWSLLIVCTWSPHIHSYCIGYQLPYHNSTKIISLKSQRASIFVNLVGLSKSLSHSTILLEFAFITFFCLKYQTSITSYSPQSLHTFLRSISLQNIYNSRKQFSIL
jgi:hypothetical protein